MTPGNGKPLGEILKKCIPHAVWLQCLKQLMWSNITLDPQIKDKRGREHSLSSHDPVHSC